MALGDYILCCKCEIKLIYDGDRDNRVCWEERFGSEPKIKCPDCEKEALTQPKPEPKFWEMPDGKIVDKWALQFYRDDIGTPLYTHPKEWAGLTDDEIIDVIHPLVMADMPDEATDYEISRAIEAKLKEKNT